MIFNKKKLFVFGISAIGVNMLNLIIGAYLCDALLTSGFVADIANRTYLSENLVIGGIWAIFITVAKIVDGVIDIPFATFLDNMNAKIGRRKAGILMGFGPMAIAFLLFLIPAFRNNLMANTFWFGGLLILFYSAYTCVMLAYYACFSEITRNEQERQFISDVKSVTDVVYFCIGYALIPVMISGMNIRLISLIFFPLSLLIMVCLFLLRGESKEPIDPGDAPAGSRGVIKGMLYTCKNKGYMRWMAVYALMTCGIQLFLTGQDVYLSGVSEFGGGTVAIVNACAFGPVPFTIMLYNYIVRKKGLRFGFVYSMLIFTVGLVFCTFANTAIVEGFTARLILAMAGALTCSFGIGTFFSISYVVPSDMAAKEKERTGYSQPSMYFAIQVLVGGIATAIVNGVVWINMREYGLTKILMIVTGVFLLLSSVGTVILPKDIRMIGKKSAEDA